MVDHFEVLRALRARLTGTTIAQTDPSAVLGINSDGHFTRDIGSFVTDGFIRGMEVEMSGFTATGEGAAPTQVITVSSSLLRPARLMAADAPAAGRSLRVGVPLLRAWENMPFKPADGRWYIDEDYLPGPVARATIGELDAWPTYVIKLYGIAGTGIEGIYKVAGAILRRFRPNLPLPLADGYTATVRSDPAPFRGQVLPEGASHALVVITVPLWVRTANIT